MMSASSIEGPRRQGGEVGELGLERLDLGGAARLDGIERAGAHHPELRLARPADLGNHSVAERRPRADELSVLQRQVREVPVQAGIEASREAGRHVRGQHGRCEQHRVRARLLDERGQRVDTRLRQGRRELRRLTRVHLRCTERARAGRDARGILAEHHSGGIAKRRRLPEHA